ncbi:MAG: hypothetical protein ABFD54_11475 [Armatimonadota bacterium]
MAARKINKNPIKFSRSVSGTIRYVFIAPYEDEEHNILGGQGFFTSCGTSCGAAKFELDTNNNLHAIVFNGGVYIDKNLGTIFNNAPPSFMKSWDVTLSFTFKISLLCDKYAEIVGQSTGGIHQDSFFAAYPDKSGGGMPGQSAEIWYEPILDGNGQGWLQVELTMDGESAVGAIPVSAGEYRYGLGDFWGSIGTDSAYVYSGISMAYSSHFDTPQYGGSFTLSSGWGVDGIYHIENGETGNYRVYADATGNAVTYYTCGGPFDYWHMNTYSIRLDLECPPYTIGYNGNIYHWDNNSVEGAILRDNLGIGGNSSHSYRGIWRFGFDGGAENEQYYQANDTGGYTHDGFDRYIDSGSTGITNCRDIGEPDYPFPPAWDPEEPYDWLGYSDGRIDINFNELSWDHVLTLNAPMSKDIIGFDYVDPWQVLSGAASFANLFPRIRVTPSQDNTSIGCDYAAKTLAGARYAAIIYDSDDTDPITIEIDGRQYEILPTGGSDKTKWIDLLKPKNATVSADTTQSARALVSQEMPNAQNYVIDGLLPTTSDIDDMLSSYIRSGSGYIEESSESRGSTWWTYTPNKDTYLYLCKGSFHIIETEHGAGEPDIPPAMLQLAKVVTDGAAITQVVDLHSDTYIVSGLEPQYPPNWDFEGEITAGSCYIDGVEIVQPLTQHTYTANKKTYIYLDASGYTFVEVALDGDEPSQPPTKIKIGCAISDDTTVMQLIVRNGVTTGLMPEIPTYLSCYIREGNAVLNGEHTSQPDTKATFAASKDTYIYLSASGFVYQPVANNAVEPAQPANTLKLAKVVTDAHLITSVSDMRTINQYDLSIPQHVSWGWGIHSAGTVKFIGLRNGKHYDLKSLTLKRDSSTFKVEIFRNPQVANTVRSSRSADEHSLLVIGSKSWDSGSLELTSYVHLTRIGVVLIDGIVAAELFGAVHIFIPSNTVPRWIHAHMLLNHPMFMYPTNGLVSANIIEPDVEAMYLNVGEHSTDGTSMEFAALPYYNSLRRGVDDASKTHVYQKYMRGCPYIRVINLTGAACTGELKTYLLDSNDPVVIESVSIPASGIVNIGSKRQAGMDYGTVVSGSGDTYVVNGLSGRNYAGFRFYAKQDKDATVTPIECTVVSHNQETDTFVLSHVFDNSLLPDTEVSVYLPYHYKLTVGEQTVTIDMRNRCYTFASMFVDVVTITEHGLLYNPATGRLIYACHGSTDGHLRYK